ncbi:MAG: hypothetical protein IT523_08505 [Burkholderiales bacterium]|nr:hypothetical protein [Burkholderiales bacterium]
MERMIVMTLAALAAGTATQALADQTNFPARSRTLETTTPSDCRDWQPPLPERRVKVTLPSDARERDGMARVTFTITPEGGYGGLVSALTNEAVFVQAAEESLRYWTFRAARCNGAAVATNASVYFDFRREGFVSYAASNPVNP